MRRGSDTHLFANYDTPAGSFAIQIPGAIQGGIIDHSMQRKPSGKVHVGGHKIRNTLNSGAFSAKTVVQGPSAGGHLNSRSERLGGWHAPLITPPSALAVAKSTGHNVPRPMELQGDGFRDDLTAPMKKRKLENGRPCLTSSSPTVVLIDDDTTHSPHFDGVVLERTTYKSRPSPSDQEKSAYQKSVGDYLEIKEPKTRRKARQSQSPSQASQHATLDGKPSTRDQNGRVIREPSFESIKYEDPDSDVVMSEEPARPAPAKSRDARKTTSIPPRRSPILNLDKDGTDAVEVRAGNEILTASMLRHAEANGRNKPALPQRPRTDIEQTAPESAIGLKQRTAQVPEMSLSNKFVRDDGRQAHRTGPRASQKMQTKSMTSKPRTSLGSEDELAGQTTIPSAASRSASPRKNNVPRHESPSDLKPTLFTTSATLQKKGQKQVETDSVSESEIKIPLNLILCHSCCLERQQDLCLVWQGLKIGGFFVEHEGKLLKTPDGTEHVCIEGRTARKWITARDDGIAVAQIKGSKTAQSNGNIILGFNDHDGLSLCYGGLYDASKNGLTCEFETTERMKKIMAHTSKEIKDDYEKHKATAETTHDDLNIDRMQKSKALRALRAPFDPEAMRYEDDASSSRRGSRSKMQASVSSNDLPTSTTSRYFVADRDLATDNRRSSRQVRPTRVRTPTPPQPPVRWTRMNKPEPWHQSVLYPSEGAPKRVTVDHQDLERLDEGEFLNDNIISFALRQIEEKMAPVQKQDVLFFNSFFYTALSNKAGRKAFNYDAVKRWTKNIDVFTKPYIVVPINIDLHWFLAIICNLQNLKRTATGLETEEPNDDEMLLDGDSEDRSKLDEEAADGATDGDLRTSETQESMRVLSISDHENDRAQGFQRRDDRANDGDGQPEPRIPRGRKSKKKAPPRQRTFDQDRPTIITLDSFGHARGPEIRLLKDYLVAEGEAKRGMSISLNDIQGVTAKGLPQQANFCDCGLFLVGYAEQFAKEPRQFATKVLQKTLKADVDFADFDPSEKRAEIRNELLRLHEEQDNERLAKKRAKTQTDVANQHDEAAQRPQAPVLVANRSQYTATTNKDAQALTASTPYVRKEESTSTALPKSRLEASIHGQSVHAENTETSSDAEKSAHRSARLTYSQLYESEKDAFLKEYRPMREDDGKPSNRPHAATWNESSYTPGPREVIEDSQERQHY